MFKVNKAQLLRMKLYINIMDDKALVKGLAAPDLAEDEKKAAWIEACRLVKEVTSAGVIAESDRTAAVVYRKAVLL